jgi:soluble lytic murein transglycosylase-like protein
VWAISALGQTPGDFGDRVRAAMAPALEKQRASVQKQAASLRAQAAAAVPVENLTNNGFFTVPWPSTATASVPVIQAACDALPKDKLDPLVQEAAKKEGVSSDLVAAVIARESAAKPCAVSPKGAQGLMQLMPAVASDFGVTDAFDARQNIEAGTRLLKQLLTKYGGDVSLALGAYNAGSARVDREGGIPPIPETINYVQDILSKVPGNQ